MAKERKNVEAHGRLPRLAKITERPNIGVARLVVWDL